MTTQNSIRKMGHDRRTRWRVVAAFASTLMILASCGGGRDDSGTAADEPVSDESQTGSEGTGFLDLDGCDDTQTGVTENEVLLGSSFPSSGPLAALGALAEGFGAFFEYANEELGGVHGRDIKLLTEDDGYDPTRTAANVDSFVEEDEVFGLIGVPSTAGNFAFWDDTEAKCVPNLMASTAAAEFTEMMNHRWTLSGLPPYAIEAFALTEHLTSVEDVETLAILAQNDDFGNSFIETIQSQFADDLDVAAIERFGAADPTVTTQVTTLADSGADALLVVGAGLKCPQAMDAVAGIAWDPVIAVPYVCTSPTLMSLADPAGSEGVLSLGWYMDPQDPQWEDHEEMQTYRDAVSEYEPQANVDDLFVANGWVWGSIVYEMLKNAPELDRASVMETGLTMDGWSPTLVLPGIQLRTSPEDPAAIEAVQVMTYDATEGRFRYLDGEEVLPEGETSILDFEGKTSELR